MCATDNLLAEAGNIMKQYAEITDADELCTAVSEDLAVRFNCDGGCAATRAFHERLLLMCESFIEGKEACSGDCTTCNATITVCISQPMTTHAIQ